MHVSEIAVELNIEYTIQPLFFLLDMTVITRDFSFVFFLAAQVVGSAKGKVPMILKFWSTSDQVYNRASSFVTKAIS